MLCEEEKCHDLCRIAKCSKEILGVLTEYELERLCEGRYRIWVIRGKEQGSAVLGGDFFNVVDSFKAIVETDTLPENMEDIECDLAQRQNL